MNQFLAGRMPLIAFPDLGFNMVHVDDVAAGVLLALDKGKPGEAYVLGGQITTMRELIQTLARVAGKKAPKRALPTALMKAMTPFGPVVGKVMGQGPNLRELISSADNVTFWAKHDKAMAELGYSPRGLEQGLRDTLEAEGKLPAAACERGATPGRSRPARGGHQRHGPITAANATQRATTASGSSPTGSPKTRMPPAIEAQFAATEVSAITGIASPVCIPRAKPKNAPTPATIAISVQGLMMRQQITRNGPGERLDRDVGHAEQQAGGHAQQRPAGAPQGAHASGEQQARPIPTAPASKEIIAAVE